MVCSCRVKKDLSAQRRAACRWNATEEDHRPLAAGARHGQERPRGFANGSATEEEAHPTQGTHCRGAEEAEVSHGNEPFWEHMEEPAADEFVRMNWFALPLCVGAIFVAQEDAAAFIIAGEATLVEGGPGDVGCEITQGAATPPAGWQWVTHCSCQTAGSIWRCSSGC